MKTSGRFIKRRLLKINPAQVIVRRGQRRGVSDGLAIIHYGVSRPSQVSKNITHVEVDGRGCRVNSCRRLILCKSFLGMSLHEVYMTQVDIRLAIIRA